MKHTAPSRSLSCLPRHRRQTHAPGCPFAVSRGGSLVASVLVGGLAMAASWPALAVPSSPRTPHAAPADVASNYGVFVEPLLPSRQPSAQEQRELLAAIGAYRKQAEAHLDEADAYGRTEPLLSYLDANPQSPWATSLLANIGWRQQRLGYVSRALETLAQADTLASGQALPANGSDLRAQADAVRGTELELDARLGRVGATRALLARPGSSTLVGGAGLQAQFAAQALAQMQREPGQTLRCGWVALGELMSRIGAPQAQRQLVDAQQAGPQGTTLAELAGWSQEHGLQLEAVHRVAGQALPVPAVVHLRSGHFATIAEASGEGSARRVHLVDNVTGTNEWVSQQAVDDESSGFYLAARQAHSEWRLASLQQAQGVRGAGNPRPYNKAATSTGDKTLGGGASRPDCGGSAVGQCFAPQSAIQAPSEGGMPVYAVQALTVGLTLHDTPVAYTPAVGPRIDFSIYYSQNDTLQPPSFTFSNLGQNWTHNWLAYIQDDPNNIGQNVSSYQRGGGGWNYTGYKAADGSFDREGLRTQLVLVSTNPLRYERQFADGSKEVYGWSDGSTASPRRVFLTQVVDPYGNAATLAYDSLSRLTTITDALGKITTVNYNGTGRRIIGVADPFGRTAKIGYDANSRVRSITDAMSMASTFTYDGTTSNVNTMTTPYGTTKFAYGVGQ